MYILSGPRKRWGSFWIVSVGHTSAHRKLNGNVVGNDVGNLVGNVTETLTETLSETLWKRYGNVVETLFWSPGPQAPGPRPQAPGSWLQSPGAGEKPIGSPAPATRDARVVVFHGNPFVRGKLTPRTKNLLGTAWVQPAKFPYSCFAKRKKLHAPQWGC